jgi:hypothetical protein
LRAHADWETILHRDADQWRAARRKAQKGPQVLIATSVGGHHPGVVFESLLAVALTLRGAQVHLLLCDQALPACLEATARQFPDQREFVEHGPSRTLCSKCYPPANRIYRSLQLPLHTYGSFIRTADKQRAAEIAAQTPLNLIREYELDGMRVGEQGYAGALRFLARADLEGEVYSEQIIRRYFEGALVATFGTQRLVA